MMPRRFSIFSPREAKVLVCMVGALIAITDAFLPSNINIATFYFVCIVLLIWSRSIRWLWIGTAIFILLTFEGIMLAAAPVVDAVSWVDWLNRGMTALALAVSAVPDHVRIRALEERERAQRALEESHTDLEARVRERTRELQASEHSLRRLSLSLIRSQDEERRRIARELHDSVGQYLSHAKLVLENWLRKNHASGIEIDGISPVTDSLETCLTETRSISYLLHPPLLDELGLISAVQSYVDGFCRRSGIRVSLNLPEIDRLPSALELVLFRILQECLTNVLRYAQSPTVDIALKNDADQIELTIRDYGKGISREFVEKFNASGQGAGIGLSGMRERIIEFHGILKIQRCEPGTEIRATLPLVAVGLPIVSAIPRESILLRRMI
ncbi:MAG: sensor histidine kinase [Candidatus Acidiferrales bacterium]